jgi:hypothetical protein
VLADIRNVLRRGLTAQMTYYETSAGAKVFAAGAFNLVESILLSQPRYVGTCEVLEVV